MTEPQGDAVLHKVAAFCRERELFGVGDGVVVACSGGVDSLSLADVLFRLRDKFGIRICVAHFEHGIRGDESKKDARFVANWAKERGLLFRIGEGNVPAFAKKNRLSVETAARRLRYEFLRETKKALGFSRIALAHHADDQAETVLMRILRGTGTAGLAAMRPKNGDMIRPLLFLSKDELFRYAESRGLSPRHDATNDVADALRNRLRLCLLPQLRREYNPELDSALVNLAAVAADETDFLLAETERVWPLVAKKNDGELFLSQCEFAKLPVALQRTVLKKFLAASGGDDGVAFAHFERLRSMLLAGKTGDCANLPLSRRAFLTYGRLKIQKFCAAKKNEELAETSVTVPGTFKLNGFDFTATTALLKKKPPKTKPTEYYCDFAKLDAPLTIRRRKRGDRIKLAFGEKKLKDVFIDDKISRDERDNVPILVCGDKVLWAAGVRRGILFAPDENTREIFYIRLF